MAKVLAETAFINSGFTIKDTSEFSKRFYNMFYGALGIPKDSPIEDIDVPITEEEDKAVENV